MLIFFVETTGETDSCYSNPHLIFCLVYGDIINANYIDKWTYIHLYNFGFLVPNSVFYLGFSNAFIYMLCEFMEFSFLVLQFLIFQGAMRGISWKTYIWLIIQAEATAYKVWWTYSFSNCHFYCFPKRDDNFQIIQKFSLKPAPSGKYMVICLSLSSTLTFKLYVIESS